MARHGIPHFMSTMYNAVRNECVHHHNGINYLRHKLYVAKDEDGNEKRWPLAEAEMLYEQHLHNQQYSTPPKTQVELTRMSAKELAKECDRMLKRVPSYNPRIHGYELIYSALELQRGRYVIIKATMQHMLIQFYEFLAQQLHNLDKPTPAQFSSEKLQNAVDV